MGEVLIVPVRTCTKDALVLRTGRLDRATERVGLAFTAEKLLRAALGDDQQWVRLSDGAVGGGGGVVAGCVLGGRARRGAVRGLPRRAVVGRHCEAGDVLVREAQLPADLRPGELLAVPCTGAYHHSMASNYNLVRRPPVVAVSDGRARPVVRRETDEDLLRRDVG